LATRSSKARPGKATAGRTAHSAARRATRALAVSEAKFQALVEEAADAFFLHDLEGRFHEVNRRACESLGYTRDELLTMRVTDVEQDFDLEAAQREWRKIQPGQPFTLGGHQRRKDGSVFPVEVRFARVDLGGEPFLMGMVRDVTERIAAEEALHQREQAYRDLVDLSPVAILVNRGGRFELANRAMLDLVGAERPEQFLGKTPWDLFHPDDHPVVRARLALVAEKGRVPPQDLRLVRLDGTVRTVAVAGATFSDARGPAIQVVLQDVTERLQGERERATLQARLEQAQKLESIGRLAGGVAHDFNNLLTVILSCCEALRDGMAAGQPPDGELVGEIFQAGQRAADLTRQLLAFARRQPATPATVDLNAVLRDQQRLLARVIGEDVRLVEALQPGLWPIRCDRGLVGQLVMNLALNARDAMRGGGTLTLATANEVLAPGQPPPSPGMAPGPWVRLTVSDTGVGMTPEILAHLFEPFFTTKAPGVGTGLGLATVYGIVRQGGGHLQVRSAPGQGATFDAWFPRDDRPAGADGPRPDPTPAPVAGRETVLLVEDEEAVRLVLLRALRDAGYRVLSAASLAEALEQASRGPSIDLVVADVVLAGGGGREVAGQVAALHPSARALFISGYPQDGSRGPAPLEDGQPFLPKPFTTSELLARVRALLDGR
jgi:PAS domain S-box-containing protein